MKVVVENVRSLCGPFSVSVRPLTLLVGENSTGKSSFLAVLAHLFSRSFPAFRPVFNNPPFDLGSYDSIATFKGGKFGRAQTFSIGFETESEKPDVHVRAIYSSHLGQPQLSTLQVQSKRTSLLLEVSPKEMSGKLTIKAPGIKKDVIEVNLKGLVERDSEMPIAVTLERALFAAVRGFPHRRVGVMDKLLYAVYHHTSRNPALALAPVRTKPRRTYDQLSDEFKPEGDHIPVILARIWGQKEETQRSRLVKALTEFGDASSLFKDISVKRLGKRPSDPFQLYVSIAGPAANLSDVGYGVSQSLPIVVQSLLAAGERRILLQQPEVHLHPRGQAALGSFFAHLVSEEKKQLVVETHSDYLVDRIRFEVAKGSLAPKDVALLYFEKDAIETTIREITIDKNGNITNAPDSYRRFFIDEDTKLLTRASR
jgi:AAA ATPase-like protein/uncharacterized protein DUF3696